MSEDNDLNEYGNHQGSFSQGVGGWAEYSVYMTKSSDTIRHDVTVPPGKIIPIIFLPGVMGSNLRMSKARQERLDRSDIRAWRPDDMMSKSGKAGVASAAEFEKTQRAKLSLLARIEQAQKNQGSFYPSRNVLREGKRDVHHWHGEESLFKRADGVHDFEWALVGTPRDVANPSEFSAHMYTKVEHNTVGAAHSASLSDDEAVALWDKLLSGLKFRLTSSPP